MTVTSYIGKKPSARLPQQQSVRVRCLTITHREKENLASRDYRRSQFAHHVLRSKPITQRPHSLMRIRRPSPCPIRPRKIHMP